MEQTINIEELIQDDHNFNKGTEAGQKLMEKSFKELGAGRSILVDRDGRIISGNKSQRAAMAAGIQKVRVIETTGDELIAVKRTDLSLDSKEGREMAYADNLTTQVNLAWDEIELEHVNTEVENFDTSDWGFDAKQLAGWEPLVPKEAKEEKQKEVKEDEFDEQKDAVPTVCALGDVWLLGEHRLMCGDSTKAENYAVLMQGEKAQMTFTSPPYNAGSINQKDNPRTHAKYGMYDDNKTSSEYLQFLTDNVKCLLQFSEEVFYNIGLVSGNKREIFMLINEFLPNFKDMIYWEKSNCAPMIQPGTVNNLVEFIICFGENGTRKFAHPQFSQGSYYNVIKGKSASDNEYSKIHKATFPVYLPAEAIKSFTDEGAVVIDCFGGTGTTMIACEQLGRKARLMELDPHYCDVIIARWEKLTGKKAVRVEK